MKKKITALVIACLCLTAASSSVAMQAGVDLSGRKTAACDEAKGLAAMGANAGKPELETTDLQSKDAQANQEGSDPEGLDTGKLDTEEARPTGSDTGKTDTEEPDAGKLDTEGAGPTGSDTEEPNTEEVNPAGSNTEEPDEEEPEKAEPYITRISFDMLLYKGDAIQERINCKAGDIHTVVSSNPSVVKAGKNGKIKALKCGKATVEAVLENDSRKETLKLHIRVKASSYAKTDPDGAGARKIKQTAKTGLTAYRELAPGKSFQLKAWEKSGSAEITYKSSNSSVARVDGDGKVTAAKKGTCTIQAALKTGKQKAVYRVLLAVKDPQTPSVTNAQKDQYFSGAVMVGNSLGVGLEAYCRRQYDGFLGNARHFSAGSFSLMNDMRPVSATSLHPKYNGVKYRVKDALKLMGAKKAFLSFGMNDLNIYGVSGTADVYQKFIQELQQKNNGLKVYIVSMTPVRRASGRLENGSIRKFNSLMEQYAKNKADIYFVDIFPPFLDNAGLLASDYCSDGFCHLTSAGYAVWTGQLKRFAERQAKKEVKAKDAVATVTESHLKQDYRNAKKLVNKLDQGELLAGHLKTLKRLKGKLLE